MSNVQVYVSTQPVCHYSNPLLDIRVKWCGTFHECSGLTKILFEVLNFVAFPACHLMSFRGEETATLSANKTFWVVLIPLCRTQLFWLTPHGANTFLAWNFCTVETRIKRRTESFATSDATIRPTALGATTLSWGLGHCGGWGPVPHDRSSLWIIYNIVMHTPLRYFAAALICMTVLYSISRARALTLL